MLGAGVFHAFIYVNKLRHRHHEVRASKWFGMNDLRSLIPPSAPKVVKSPPEIGGAAPALKELSSTKPAVIAFLRHIGCPFAEKTFRNFRTLAEQCGHKYQYIAISHGTEEDTTNWTQELGGAVRITVVSDPSREIYGEWVTRNHCPD
jgi:hypothetical protein